MVPRPAAKETVIAPYRMVTKGTLVGFYAMAGLYILLGGFEVLAGAGVFGSIGDFMKSVYIIFGAIMALIGFGLMFRPPFVYAMMAMFCSIQAVLGVVFIIASVMTIELPVLKYVLIGVGALQLPAAGFMFYFSEETAVSAISAQ